MQRQFCARNARAVVSLCLCALRSTPLLFIVYGKKKVNFLHLNVIQIIRTTFKSMSLPSRLNWVSTIPTWIYAVLWMNGHGLNRVKFNTCCYFYSKSLEVTRSAVIENIGSGTSGTTMLRSIRGIAAGTPLSMYYPGTPLAITCWYIYIYIYRGI